MVARTANAALHWMTSLPFLLVFGILSYFVVIPTWQRLESPDNWIKVHSVRVDSGWVGTDRPMSVVREIRMKVPTRGIWTAKISNSRGEVVCSNSNMELYTPNAMLPPRGELYLLDWWLNDGPLGPASVCKQWPLPPGLYTLSTQRELFPRNYPTSKVIDSPDASFFWLERPSYLSPQTSLWRAPRPPDDRG